MFLLNLGKREVAESAGFFVNDGEEKQKLTSILPIRQYKMYLNKKAAVGVAIFPQVAAPPAPLYLLL